MRILNPSLGASVLRAGLRACLIAGYMKNDGQESGAVERSYEGSCDRLGCYGINCDVTYGGYNKVVVAPTVDLTSISNMFYSIFETLLILLNVN
jgi:hypothetical protein